MEVKDLRDREFIVEMSNQRVLLLPDEMPEKTKSGIYLPKNAEEERPKVCTVIAVGKGDKDIPMQYSPGQVVLISKYSGTETELNIMGYGFRNFIVTNQIDIQMKLREVKNEGIC